MEVTWEFGEVVCLFFNPHPMICLLIFEREEGGERETAVGCHTFPDQGSNRRPRYDVLHVPGPTSKPAIFGARTMLQPTEPPSQGEFWVSLTVVF